MPTLRMSTTPTHRLVSTGSLRPPLRVTSLLVAFRRADRLDVSIHDIFDPQG
ncbi:MAG: hypothetical protein KIT69_04445 [Propionibacteriaceae bacterium]|nr:hypothetical protein [Propionibacteriaceae bacterium]